MRATAHAALKVELALKLVSLDPNAFGDWQITVRAVNGADLLANPRLREVVQWRPSSQFSRRSFREKMKQTYCILLISLLGNSISLAQNGAEPVFTIEKELVTLSANGAFQTSDGNGSFSATSAGTVTVQGEDTIFLRPNAAKDVLVGGVLSDDDPNDLIEFIGLVKRPSSLSLADLAGNWKLIEMEIGLSTGLLAAGVDTEILPIVIQPNGSFDAPDGTLNFQVAADNRLQVNAGAILEFDINASMNFMLGIHEDTENGETSYLIRLLLREGNPEQISDLSGAWRKLDYSVESFMDRDYTYFSTPEDRLSVNSQGGTSENPIQAGILNRIG